MCNWTDKFIRDNDLIVEEQNPKAVERVKDLLRRLAERERTALGTAENDIY
jgi:molybdate-binding protein